jgi:hypothetical protein
MANRPDFDPERIDFSDLQLVKQYATKMSYLEGGRRSHMTVILRPGHTSYNIIHTASESWLLKDAMIVYRTGEHADSESVWGEFN